MSKDAISTLCFIVYLLGLATGVFVYTVGPSLVDSTEEEEIAQESEDPFAICRDREEVTSLINQKWSSIQASEIRKLEKSIKQLKRDLWFKNLEFKMGKCKTDELDFMIEIAILCDSFNKEGKSMIEIINPPCDCKKEKKDE